jgi:hypothetical protein
MHPLPHKNGIPYSQLCGVKFIYGHLSDFDSNAKKITEILNERLQGQNSSFCNDENILKTKRVIAKN